MQCNLFNQFPLMEFILFSNFCYSNKSYVYIFAHLSDYGKVSFKKYITVKSLITIDFSSDYLFNKSSLLNGIKLYKQVFSGKSRLINTTSTCKRLSGSMGIKRLLKLKWFLMAKFLIEERGSYVLKTIQEKKNAAKWRELHVTKHGMNI